MSDFLLEVGTEEIPDWMIENALADLDRLFRGIGLKLFELQFCLIEQFAAALGRGGIAVMLKLGDHKFQMRDHRLRTERSDLSLPTCHTLGGKFSAQRVYVVGDRIGGFHRNNQGITIARGRTRIFVSTRHFFKISARHLRPPGSLRVPPVDPFQRSPMLMPLLVRLTDSEVYAATGVVA